MTFNLWYKYNEDIEIDFILKRASFLKTIPNNKGVINLYFSPLSNLGSSNNYKNNQNCTVSKFILERNYKTQLDWNVVELKKLLSTTYVDTSYLTKKNCICLSAINPITLKGFDQVILESLFVGSYIKINSKIGYGKAISWLT